MPAQYRAAVFVRRKYWLLPARYGRYTHPALLRQIRQRRQGGTLRQFPHRLHVHSPTANYSLPYRRTIQNFCNAVCGRTGNGNHHKDHRKHHQAHHNLRGIRKQRHQRSGGGYGEFEYTEDWRLSILNYKRLHFKLFNLSS